MLRLKSIELWRFYLEVKRNHNCDHDPEHAKRPPFEDIYQDWTDESADAKKTMGQQHPELDFFRVVYQQDADVDHNF